MAEHQSLAPPAHLPMAATAPASPLSPTYTDFSSASSDFAAEIRSPLDDAFAQHQHSTYAARGQPSHAQDEFFAYNALPWASPVEQKKPLTNTGYYAANVVFPVCLTFSTHTFVQKLMSDAAPAPTPAAHSPRSRARPHRRLRSLPCSEGVRASPPATADVL